jgi:D-sedoheptulose 7-phosphate isomerase
MYLGSPNAEIFERAVSDHLDLVESFRSQKAVLMEIAEGLLQCLRDGGKIVWCGNGGSAADAQHLAAEFVGRFKRKRRGLPSLALTTDSSILTAVANDFGYETVFARQVEALCTAHDVVVGISTSGNSRNVCAALEAARELGAGTVGFTGQGGGTIRAVADLTLSIPSTDTARIQEVHILSGHILCDWIEAIVAAESGHGSESQ